MRTVLFSVFLAGVAACTIPQKGSNSPAKSSELTSVRINLPSLAFEQGHCIYVSQAETTITPEQMRRPGLGARYGDHDPFETCAGRGFNNEALDLPIGTEVTISLEVRSSPQAFVAVESKNDFDRWLLPRDENGNVTEYDPATIGSNGRNYINNLDDWQKANGFIEIFPTVIASTGNCKPGPDGKNPNTFVVNESSEDFTVRTCRANGVPYSDSDFNISIEDWQAKATTYTQYGYGNPATPQDITDTGEGEASILVDVNGIVTVSTTLQTGLNGIFGNTELTGASMVLAKGQCGSSVAIPTEDFTMASDGLGQVAAGNGETIVKGALTLTPVLSSQAATEDLLRNNSHTNLTISLNNTPIGCFNIPMVDPNSRDREPTTDSN